MSTLALTTNVRKMLLTLAGPIRDKIKSSVVGSTFT
jgi:hypothetical protein